MMKQEKYVIRPFNKVFNTLCIIFVLIGLISVYLINKNGVMFGRTYTLVISIANLVLFVFYRLSFLKDKEYAEVAYKDYGKVNMYNELPFYPCNLVMILTPFAILFNNHILLVYCFFFALIGPIAAICVPCLGFSDYGIFKPRVFGYYVTHLVAMLNIVLFISSKIYIPQYIDAFKLALITIVFSILAHILNIILIKTGKNKDANYFFTMSAQGNPVFEAFYKLIRVKLLWLTPLIVIVYLYAITFTYIIKLI